MFSKNKLYLEDIEKIIKNVPIDELKNKSIFITGASGLICSSIVDTLIYINDRYNANITVYASGRSLEGLNNRFVGYVNRQDFHAVIYDVNDKLNYEEKVDYIIHGASNANPALYVSNPVETILTNIIGLNNLLSYSAEHKVKRVLNISSSEVYGNKENNDLYLEDEYGFVDILNSRACYPSSKRTAETLAAAYNTEYGVDVVMVRPGHVYGPTMTKSDNRASSSFARDVVNDSDIIMKSKGEQIRSYCYVLDCVSAILNVLINGKSGDAYNISNPNSVCSIKDIAESFAEAGNKKVIITIPDDKEKKGFNLMLNSALNADKLLALGWHGEFDVKTGTKHTIEILKSLNN